VELLPTPIDDVKYDLFLNIQDVRSQLNLTFDYNSGIISEAAIKRWADYYIDSFEDILKVVKNEEKRGKKLSKK
ncbi:MAG: hypothetical protein N3D84_02500, partial [Candidatus Woesearchaeota archaeon]|nr:hypothetical protein [Candidatus Woesearchaeota archaeon]